MSPSRSRPSASPTATPNRVEPGATVQTATDPLSLMLVGDHPAVAAAVNAWRQVAPRCFGDIEQARRHAADHGVDVALIVDDGGDATLALTRDLASSRTPVQVLLLSESPTVQRTIAAMRAGAADLIALPADESELLERVRHAGSRRRRVVADADRIRKLRRACRRLNRMRARVADQVDVLCHDLVNAYQELALQMTSVSYASEFGAMIKDQLDLEQVLRRTLEYVVGKSGPTNAAIFLPSSLDEYTLGGYVNYDCQGEGASPDVLLDHLADVVAPRLAEAESVVHVSDNDTMARWLGDDATYFENSHLVGFVCRNENEPLAVILLFRDGGEPFTQELLDACEAVGPALGRHLAKLIGIHHRATPADPGDDELQLH